MFKGCINSVLFILTIGAWWIPSLVSASGLTWQACLEKTKQTNSELQAAQLIVQQARQDLTIAISNWYPQASLNASVNKGTDFDYSDPTTYSAGVSIQQLIFDGFKTPATIGQAKVQLEKAQISYAETSASIRYQLRLVFVALLKSDELLTLTESIAKRRKQNLGLVRLRYQAGREHIGSLLTAQADLAQAEFEVNQAKRENRLVRIQLANIMGDDHLEMEISGSLEEFHKSVSPPDMKHLLKNSLNVKASKAAVELANWSLTAAYSGFYPSLSLSASATLSDDHWFPEEKRGALGVSLSVPLFSGGHNLATITKAKQTLSETKHNLKTILYTSRQSLEESWKNLSDASDQVDVEKKFWQAAKARAKIANAQYSSGLVTFDDWSIIEDRLVSAQKSYLNAKTQLLLNEAQWIQIRGEGLDHE